MNVFLCVYMWHVYKKITREGAVDIRGLLQPIATARNSQKSVPQVKSQCPKSRCSNKRQCLSIVAVKIKSELRSALTLNKVESLL